MKQSYIIFLIKKNWTLTFNHFLFIESFENNCRNKAQQGTQIHIETNLSVKIIFLTRNQEEINQSYDDNKKAYLIKHGYQFILYSFMNNGHAAIVIIRRFHHSAIVIMQLLNHLAAEAKNRDPKL